VSKCDLEDKSFMSHDCNAQQELAQQELIPCIATKVTA
jgi:hypothetical protein